MRAVLIPPEGPPRAVAIGEGGESTYDSLSRLVGEDGIPGMIEVMNIGRDDATSYGNEEAKMREPRMDENPIATRMVFGPGSAEVRNERTQDAIAVHEEFMTVIQATDGDPREPYVAGPVVVTGFDPRTGETTPIPDDLAEQLLSMSNV